MIEQPSRGPGRRQDAPDRVLLLHGMGCGPWVWREVEAALPPHLTAVAPVVAGHRGGTRLSRDAANSAPEQMVDDLERQLDQLSIDRIHVVGNSLGGWLALRLAERGRALSVLCLAPAGGWRPGSVGEKLVVSRFVLGHRVARRLERTPRFLRAARVRRAVLAPVVHDPPAVTVADTVRFVQDLADCQALRAAIGHAEARQLTAILRVGAPTTIAWSGDDRVLSGDWARDGFRHLRVDEVDVPDVGHLPMLDDPGLVAELIANRVRTAAPSSP
ncbi:alpha/beta fold hydrolase [Nocardioides sp. WS12]|uniref:alpha/beta fold hydrolase n=1 Tax=Nocardioides sp. WS12 TaxID=2486272 RepID=UPI0015FCAA89|nr:alpha/beta fold hydrolase [Nocardioides sp. WS12]